MLDLQWKFLSFVSLLLLILSCSTPDEPLTTVKLGGTYRIPITRDITNLDPISGESNSWIIGSQIFEGLVTHSRDEPQIIPLLAESYEISDRTLTFHLRQAIRFHDDVCFPNGEGREFTAEDVKYSFERRLRTLSDSRSTRFGPFVGYEEFITGKSPHVKGFRVVDKFTFQLQLTRPYPGLLNDKIASSGFFIVPR